MPREKIQSAIRDCRDQLFLDTATGIRLNIVGSNLGVDRPIWGVNDDHWRYVVKQIALQTKGVTNIFHRVLEAFLGPRKTQIGDLAVAATVGDKIITVHPGSGILQAGVITLDPGTAVEETVQFCYHDVNTHQIYLNTALVNSHAATVPGATVLIELYPAGDTTLHVYPGGVFSLTNYPYPLIIDRGLPTEEIVQVASIAQYPVVDELNLVDPTVYQHEGYYLDPLCTVLAEDAPSGRMFLKLADPPEYADGINRVMPASGYVIFSGGLGPSEPAQYLSSDLATRTIFLKRPVVVGYAAGTVVNLARAVSTVETCSVVQRGIGWDVFETQHKKVQVYLPESLNVLHKQDTAWFHGTVLPFVSTTAPGELAETDTVIDVVSTAGFPDPAGMIQIGSSRVFFYTRKDSTRFWLSHALGTDFGPGASVSLVRVPYAGTALENGNWLESGSYEKCYFPGPYVYSAADRSPSSISSTLSGSLGPASRNIPPPLQVVYPQTSSFSTLEVDILGMHWSGIPSPDTILVGAGTGFSEEVEYRDIILNSSDSATTVTSRPDSLTLICADTSGLPTATSSSSGAGYRIRVGAGTANDEILIVKTNSTSTNTLTLVNPATHSHASSETVSLLAHVIETDPLTQPHAVGHKVQQVLRYVTVSSTSVFPSTGTVLVNFGNAVTSARSYVSASPDASWLYLENSSEFPTGTFPCVVFVAEGTPRAQCHRVTSNNVAGNKLGGTTFLDLPISVGDSVTFYGPGVSEIPYIGKRPNEDEAGYADLLFPDGVVTDYGHDNGSVVVYSPGYSIPLGTGQDFPFYVPPDPAGSMRVMLDLIRAAGVELIFLSDR